MKDQKTRFSPATGLQVNRPGILSPNSFFAVAAGAIICLGADISMAAQVSFSSSRPKLGMEDIANWNGATTSEENVAEGSHDATYVADDRPVQGQTFTTGTNAAGYELRAVALRQVKHETYALIPDLNYTLRIIQPSANTFAEVASETANVPSATPGNLQSIGDGSETGNGSGIFVTFTLEKPVHLRPDTIYGFDVGGGSSRHYWQVDGTLSQIYSGGTAYSVEGKDKFTPRRGERVFVVSLTATKAESAARTGSR